MLATAIRIDTELESDIGRIVVGDNGARGVAEELSRWRNRILRIEQIKLGLERDRLKPIGRIGRLAAAVDGKRKRTHRFDCKGNVRSGSMFMIEICFELGKPRHAD